MKNHLVPILGATSERSSDGNRISCWNFLDMARTPVKPAVQAEVLLKSRRRCCVCYGLNRDTSLKAGQIAHLDQNAKHGGEDNLAFMCFLHHDEYDSTTRQRKNFTREEVRRFRSELYQDVEVAFSAPVHFSDTSTEEQKNSLEGHYIRISGRESAEITLQRLPDNRYHVSGFALWGEDRKYGPNTGELDFASEEVEENILKFTKAGIDKTYKATLIFNNGKLTVVEENYVGEHGINVTFNGEYQTPSASTAISFAASPFEPL